MAIALEALWLRYNRSFTGTMTLMDKLAYLLHKGLNIAQAASSWVLYLIRKIMQLLGFGKAIEKADLTYHFIRQSLIRLSTLVNDYCQRILDSILVDGRGV